MHHDSSLDHGQNSHDVVVLSMIGPIFCCHCCSVLCMGLQLEDRPLMCHEASAAARISSLSTIDFFACFGFLAARSHSPNTRSERKDLKL